MLKAHIYFKIGWLTIISHIVKLHSRVLSACRTQTYAFQHSWIELFQNVICKNPEHVHNMIITGLIYRLLPKQTYLHKTEQLKRNLQYERKDRIMLYIFTFVTGLKKLIFEWLVVKESTLPWTEANEIEVFLLW